MGLRVEEFNGLAAGVLDSLKSSKVEKAQKAFSNYLNNAVSGNSGSGDDYATKQLKKMQGEQSKDSKFAASNKNVTEDKLVKADNKVAQTDAFSENKEELSDEEIVAKLEEAIKMAVAEMLGITPQELDAKLEMLDMEAVDLLDSANMLEFVMEINGIEDAGAVLTDENLLNQIKDLTEKINYVAEDVLTEVNMSPQQLEEAIEKVKTGNAPKTDIAENNVNTSNVTNVEESKVVFDNILTQTDTSENENGNFDNLNSAMQPQNTVGQAVLDNIQNAEVSYSSVDMEDVVNQILEQVKVQINTESTSMEMQLNPESLGRVHVNVIMKDGMLTAAMAVENEAVRNSLEAQVIQLRESLNNQGIKVEAVEVTIASHEFDRNLQQDSNANQQAYEEEQKKSASRRANLNLVMEDLDAEELGGLTQAEELERQMMLNSGNRMSIQA